MFARTQRLLPFFPLLVVEAIKELPGRVSKAAAVVKFTAGVNWGGKRESATKILQKSEG